MEFWTGGGGLSKGRRRHVAGRRPARRSRRDALLAGQRAVERLEAMVAEYRSEGRAAGWPPERLAVAAFKDLCLGDTVEEAEAARDALVADFYDEHILGYGYLVDGDGRHLYNPPRDHPAYRTFVDSIFCGTIGMATEELARYERLGLHAVYISSPHKEIIAREVIPQLTRTRPATTSATGP